MTQDSTGVTQPAACPYCSIVLQKAPQRKSKCKSCGETIFVRGGVAVTQARADELDAEHAAEVARLDAEFIAASDARNRASALAQLAQLREMIRDNLWVGVKLQLLMVGPNDPRVPCDQCRDIAGRGPWDPLDQGVPVPPFHVGCTCTWVVEFPDTPIGP